MTSRSRIASASLPLLLALAPAGALATKDVPFVVTPDNVVESMLELAKVGPDDHVVDLGSGDGRIVITAARRFGASGTGVEIVPEMVARSTENARRAGVEGKVRFVEQDLFKADLTKATVVTLYLMPDVNLKLRPSLLELTPGTRIVSHDWDMGDWKPDRTVSVEGASAKAGVKRTRPLYLWVVPGDFDGLWCGEGNATGTRIVLNQEYQKASATVSNVRGVHYFEANIDARRLETTGGEGKLSAEEKDGRMHVRGAGGPFAHLAGTSFTKSCCGSCAY
jgi:SAM-dependent methyltransferase